ERLNVADDPLRMLQRVDADALLAAKNHGLIVEQQFHDLSRLVPDAHVIVIGADDRAAKLVDRQQDDESVPDSTGPHDSTSVRYACRPWKTTYSAGSTISVRAAAENRPPMITTARGRCTSDPMLCESAIGIRPNIASSVVIRTVRSRTIDPSSAASCALTPVRRSWLK